MRKSIQFIFLSVLLAVSQFCGAEETDEEKERLETEELHIFRQKVTPALLEALATLKLRLDRIPDWENIPDLVRDYNLINETIVEAFSQDRVDKAEGLIRNVTASVQRLEKGLLNTCTLCNATDHLGYQWKACPNETAYRPCNKSGFGRHYYITWKCGSEGTFLNEKPDKSKCRSLRLDNLNRRLKDNLTNVAKGQVPLNVSRNVLDDLFTAVGEENTGAYSKSAFRLDIPRILEIAKDAVVLTNQSARFSEVEDIGKLSLYTMLAVLENQKPWKELELDSRSRKVTNVIDDIDTVAFHLLRRVGFENGKSKTFSLRKDGKGPSIITLGSHKGKEIEFTDDNRTSIAVKLSANVYKELNISENDYIKYVGTVIKSSLVENLLGGENVGSYNTGITLPELGHNRTLYMNGKLLSFTLRNTSTSVTLPDSSVTVTFWHNVLAFGEKRGIVKRRLYPGEEAKAVLGESTCVYWNTRNFSWSTDGCRKENSNSTATVCKCNHLSSFAVLTGYHTYYSAERNSGLEILTWLLSGTSIICLFASVAIFTSLKAIRTDQVKITTGLCISLIFANIFLHLGDKNNYSSQKSNGFCMVIGILNHYAWLSVFGWMAVEGIHLYHQVVKVFKSANEYLFKFYYFLGYGVPAIIVAITALAGYGTTSVQDIYVGDVYCWLTGRNVWAFMGPVLVVVIGNLIILFVAVRIAITRGSKRKGNKTLVLKINTQKIEQRKVNKKLIIGTTSLSFLLGITWSIGFFTIVDFEIEEVSLVFSYIFTLLNASQGIFIFVFHCYLNETVRQKLTQVVTTRISFLSRSTNSTTPSSPSSP